MLNTGSNNKNNGKSIEKSLMELLNKEDACVNRLNELYRAFDIAKRSGLRYAEYEKDIKSAENKLKECRQEIGEYFGKYINSESK